MNSQSITTATATTDPVTKLNEIADALIEKCEGSRFEAYRLACKRNPQLARAAREDHALASRR